MITFPRNEAHTVSTKRNVWAPATIAAALRRAADRLDPPLPAPRPEIKQLKEAQRYEVEVALLDAEADEERQRFTVGMLRERLRRLQL
jgi:hypothetical protein